MAFLYQLGMFFYSVFIHFGSFFNEKARLFAHGRKNWKANIAAKIDSGAKYVWFHCASLGEFEQGRPVIEELKLKYPEYKIVLTFFSPSGYEIRKNYQLADIVSYLPLDTKRNATEFLNILKPEKVFFIKYEFWYFYISELKRRKIPLYIISAIFRENQQFFKDTPVGKWYRKMLFNVEHFFIQNEKSGELLKTIGISNFTVSGDTRFDRVAAIAGSAKEIPLVEKFKGDRLLIIAGSTWKPDEELLAEFINQSGLKFIIAPHEVSEGNINRIHQLLKKPAISFSKVTESEIDRFQVLIIDSVGLLSSLYRYGNIAYIGGGFGVGIHNILEAATFGLPVIFGPNYKKFKEAVDLINEGGAFTISNYNELGQALINLIDQEYEREKATEICRNYVAKNVGSTQIIIKKVFNI
ncbi:MAG: 3-deoxy-D-manno-octulosonic acid transferase [Bacteroidetes bacterium]|nr:MAG: 3-deoxy-D-manno-octulosonic acid transferase [Bacteroidota bacterium]